MPSITFTEQGDGTVLVTTAGAYTFTVTDTSQFAPDQPSIFRGSLVQDGLEIIVSGDTDELTYDLAANSYGIQLDEIVDFGEVIPMEGALTFNQMTGTYVVRPGAVREIDYVVNAATTDMVFNLDSPEEGVMVNFTGDIADLALQAQLAIPEDLDFEDSENLDFEGFSVVAGYTFGALNYAFDFDDGRDQADGTASSSGGFLDLVFNENEVSYDTAVQDMAVAMTVPDFPVPINVSIAEYGIAFGMPLSRTEEPAPFKAGINLTEIAINDEIWMLGDPGGQLPHDPITAQIGISGTATWLFDLLDPAQQMDLMRSDMPLEPNSVQIDTLNIQAIGLDVTGDGAFTFDNTRPGPIPGLPAPEGQVSITANGVNSLMDTAVAMGLIGQNEVMQTRMMMGIFATATGNDGLTSTLEINGEGHVIVNGQRMQ